MDTGFFTYSATISQAYEEGKDIANLDWLVYVLFASRSDYNDTNSVHLPSSMDRLLHYPWPKTPLPNFQKNIITVSGYTGPARDALKKMIELMGGKFEGNMTKGRTTHVVSATYSGNKVQHARLWDIPVINHTWVEDCFIGWQARTPTMPSYTSYDRGGEGFTFASLVGTRTISPNIIADWAAREEVLSEREAALEEMIRLRTEGSNMTMLASEDPVTATQSTPDPPSQSRQIARNRQTSTSTVDITENGTSSRASTSKMVPLPKVVQGQPGSSSEQRDRSDAHSSNVPPVLASENKEHNLCMLDDSADLGPSDDLEARQREERAVEAALIEKPRPPLKRKTPPFTSTPNTPQGRQRLPIPAPSSTSTINSKPASIASGDVPVKRKKISLPNLEDVEWDPRFTPRTSSGRKAAENAAQKLHEVIMPDVMNFAEEQKGGGKKRLDYLFGGRDKDGLTEKHKPKARSSLSSSISKPNGKSTHRDISDEPEDSEGEPVADIVPSRTATQKKATMSRGRKIAEPPTPEVVSKAGKSRIDKLKQTAEVKPQISADYSSLDTPPM